MSPATPIPPAVEAPAARALAGRADILRFRAVQPLGGGCVHPARRVESPDGRPAFLKWSTEAGFGGFAVEAVGLRSLAERSGIRVPEVLGVGNGAGGDLGWLLLEYVETDARSGRDWDGLGIGLAELHRPLASGSPGWESDGWIGPIRQANLAPTGDAAVSRGATGRELSWPEFWRDARLAPLWHRVGVGFPSAVEREFERLLSHLEGLLDGWREDGLSLLHGDLWTGNVLWSERGEPVLIDPAAYRGHREVDLAMMELFGGFDPAVFRSYRRVLPTAAGYAELRRDLYQLYPLLVHVALFGDAYRPPCGARIGRIMAEWG